MKVFNFGTPINPVPSLEDQAKQAMNIQTPTFDPNQPVPSQEEEYDPSNIDHITRGNEYVSAIEAILANAKPQLDPEKEKRYKQRAALTSFGQGLKTIFDGLSHTQGMNVQPDQNQNVTYSNEALAKLQDDYKNKMETYNNMLTQGKLQGLNYREQLRDAADKMKYMWNVNKANNAQKDKEFQFEKEYKTKSLKQDNDQFVKKLAQDLGISEATLKQRKSESDQEHRERLAAIAAQRENNYLDFQAAMNKGKNKDSITFINPETKTPDTISDISARAIVEAYKSQYEKGKSKFVLDKEATIPGTEYNLIVRYMSGGGLTNEELKTLMGFAYKPETKIATKQFSDNDLQEAYKRYAKNGTTTSPTPNTTKSSGGWQRVDANGNPIK